MAGKSNGVRKKPAVANGKNHGKNGRFTKGNDAGGNHYAGYISKLRAALYEAVTEEDIKKIAQAQIRKAQNSTDAAKFVYDYVFGRPTQQVNIGGQEDNPLEVKVGGNLSEEDIRRIAGAVSAGGGAAK